MTDLQEHHFTIAESAEESSDFLRVLWTGRHAQLALMTIPTGGQIGEEVHGHADQVLAFVRGEAEVVVAEGSSRASAGDVVVVPAGQRHDVVNVGSEPLRLYTIYGPPAHAVDAVYATRVEAEAAEESGEDVPPPQGI